MNDKNQGALDAFLVVALLVLVVALAAIVVVGLGVSSWATLLALRKALA